LFFVPLALLAMTGPFLVRVLTSSVQTVGGNAGRLIAVSTVGSFIGTVLIGYVLLPFLCNSVTMFLTSALLIAIVVAYFLCWGKAERNVPALAASVILGLLAGYGGVRRDAMIAYQN